MGVEGQSLSQRTPLLLGSWQACLSFQKELALSILASELSSLQMLILCKAIPSQASDEAQGWGGAQTLISLRSKAGVESTPGKRPSGNLEQQLKMSHVIRLNWVNHLKKGSQNTYMREVCTKSDEFKRMVPFA